MNKNRRELLKKALDSLDLASSYTDRALEQEQDCLNNMPENLEYSCMCEKMESAIDRLNDAIDNINEAISNIEYASE